MSSVKAWEGDGTCQDTLANQKPDGKKSRKVDYGKQQQQHNGTLQGGVICVDRQ